MITYGMDYYPEHWDESMWEEDCTRMAALGVNVVRIAEFAWCRMEPTEGQFDFAWLDRAIQMIADHGMKVILGTPTNCAPQWLYHNYPETMQTEGSQGLRRRGIRGHRCYNNEVFRYYAGRIIREMAKRYAGRQEIYAWQIDNELDNSHCTCPVCRNKFRTYVKEKYQTLDALNRAYGNVVWSAEYSDWQQVEPPQTDGLPGDYYNTALMLDFERFGAETTVDYVRFQEEIIHSFDPDAVITTNACFPQHMPDFHKEFAPLSVASYDNYPPIRLPEDPEALYSNAFALDFVRGFKQQNFWIMEQLAGQMGCWGPISPIPVPGQLEGYALQAVAHGADLLCFFRWRTAATGSEMFCHGLLDHNNKDNRRLRELKHLFIRLEQYPNLDTATPRSEVAILYSSEQEFALKNQWQSDGYAYWTQMRLFHEACMNLGVNVDVVEEHSSLEKYRVVILPSHFITDEKVVEAVERFTEAGGTVILTNRSGVKDAHGNCIVGEYLPTVLGTLAGCHVEEYDPIGRTKQQIITSSGETYTITSWCDLLVADTAEVWASYADHYYEGVPAIMKNRYGKGTAYYVGTVGTKSADAAGVNGQSSVCGDVGMDKETDGATSGRNLYHALLREALKESGVSYAEGLPQGVELCSRSDADVTYQFLFNNTDHSQSLLWKGKQVEMQPFEVIIE